MPKPDSTIAVHTQLTTVVSCTVVRPSSLWPIASMPVSLFNTCSMMACRPPSAFLANFRMDVYYPSCSLTMCWYQMRSPYSSDLSPGGSSSCFLIWTPYTSLWCSFPLGQNNTYSCSANSCRLLLVFGRHWQWPMRKWRRFGHWLWQTLV